MDLSTARSILTELIGHLPLGYWWLIHQKEENELGPANAFGHRRADTDALLVNAGIGKQTIQGFGIVKREWESYKLQQ